MSLQKWNNRNLPLFDTLMDNFFGNNVRLLRSTDLGLSTPAANVLETENSYEVELAAPGKSKEDFNVEVDNGAISISSQTETSNESENKTFARKEYSYESFQRSSMLPENVDDSRIEASYTDGVLKIVVPNAEVSKPEAKTIPIS